MRLYHTKPSAYLEQTYTLQPNSYVVDYGFKLVGFDKYLANNTNLELDWKTNLIKQEQALDNERHTTSIYYKEQAIRPLILSETANDKKSISFSLDWVAFKQQFFNTTLIAPKSFNAGELFHRTSHRHQQTLSWKKQSPIFAYSVQTRAYFRFSDAVLFQPLLIII